MFGTLGIWRRSFGAGGNLRHVLEDKRSSKGLLFFAARLQTHTGRMTTRRGWPNHRGGRKKRHSRKLEICGIRIEKKKRVAQIAATRPIQSSVLGTFFCRCSVSRLTSLARKPANEARILIVGSPIRVHDESAAVNVLPRGYSSSASQS